jgi:hypothetical protein
MAFEANIYGQFVLPLAYRLIVLFNHIYTRPVKLPRDFSIEVKQICTIGLYFIRIGRHV